VTTDEKIHLFEGLFVCLMGLTSRVLEHFCLDTIANATDNSSVSAGIESVLQIEPVSCSCSMFLLVLFFYMYKPRWQWWWLLYWSMYCPVLR